MVELNSIHAARVGLMWTVSNKCVKKPLVRAVFSLRERKCGGCERLVD
jgi:hypothetical protein